jgi:hypothetical protein
VAILKEKINAVKALTRPENVNLLKRFIEFCDFFGKYVPNFGKLIPCSYMKLSQRQKEKQERKKEVKKIANREKTLEIL